MGNQDRDTDISPGSSIPPCEPHDVKVMCQACTPVLRNFSIDDIARGIAKCYEKVVLELAASSGVPAGLVEELFTCLLLQEMVEKWTDREFVQDESICQSCGTRKPHKDLHCLLVKGRMTVLGLQVTMTEMHLAELIGEMKQSLSDALRRKLLSMSQ